MSSWTVVARGCCSPESRQRIKFACTANFIHDLHTASSRRRSRAISRMDSRLAIAADKCSCFCFQNSARRCVVALARCCASCARARVAMVWALRVRCGVSTWFARTKSNVAGRANRSLVIRSSSVGDVTTCKPCSGALCGLLSWGVRGGVNRPAPVVGVRLLRGVPAALGECTLRSPGDPGSILDKLHTGAVDGRKIFVPMAPLWALGMIGEGGRQDSGLALHPAPGRNGRARGALLEEPRDPLVLDADRDLLRPKALSDVAGLWSKNKTCCSPPSSGTCRTETTSDCGKQSRKEED